MSETVTSPQAAFVGGSERAPDAAAVEAAVAGVVEVAPALARTSAYDRAVVLEAVAAALEADAEGIAAELTAESGYLTVRDMTGEVGRTIEVFRQTAAVARVGLTEALDLDAIERARNTIGLIKRVPLGPALGITAFNGPLLIAAHKVAPAIAAGVPLVLKPSPRVPGAAVALGRLVVDAGWPAAALAVLPVDDALTMELIRDPRLPVISFTGGAFGWRIKDEVPRKHVHLELGGVGAVVIAADGDVGAAAAECAAGGFVRSGQACISVQRVYVERGAYEPFLEAFGALVSSMVTGAPDDPATQVGPLVDDAAADRVEAMIADATGKGARLVCGGERDGRTVTPAVLADVTPEMDVSRREAFGPVVAVAPCDSLADAVTEVNAVDGAILAGVYTQDLDAALSLVDAIDAGGVIVNGPTSWRVDHMPYGGVGTSGFGREGVTAMIAEYTQEKVVVIRHKPTSLGA